MKAPATIVPTPVRPNVALITNVSARPRSSSLIPRCTSSALQTTAMPFPIPPITHAPAAIQMSALAAPTPKPSAIKASPDP